MLELERQLGICQNNASLLTDELLRLEDELKQLKQTNMEQKNEIKRKEERITVIFEELNTVSGINAQLESQLQTVTNQYTALSQEHETCHLEDPIIYASIQSKGKIISHPYQSTELQLPENFSKVSLHILLIIISITILTAAIQGLIKSLRRKSRTLVR